jgi:hypothetical protein
MRSYQIPVGSLFRGKPRWGEATNQEKGVFFKTTDRITKISKTDPDWFVWGDDSGAFATPVTWTDVEFLELDLEALDG